MRLEYLIVLALVVGLSGCATTRKDARDTQIQQLQVKVVYLEKQLQQTNEEIGYLGEKLDRSQGRTTMKAVSDAPLSTKQIQTALKSAGFYTGAIDGKAGKATEKAILDFQKANDLKVDGVVGSQTRAKLRQYLP